MAKQSAFFDHRFKPLREKELENILVEITILTPTRKINNYKEIILGKHGIILKKAGRQAVFLPQVPLGLGWNLETTLKELSKKAGLREDAWKTNCEFHVFEGIKFQENKLQN